MLMTKCCEGLKASDWIALASLICVVIGGAFAFWRWVIGQKEKHSDRVTTLTKEIRTNKSILAAFKKIDYSENWYNFGFHESSDESDMDSLLSFFSNICFLLKRKVLTKKDFEYFAYYIDRICVNEDAQLYMWNLYHYTAKNGYRCSFIHLINYGIKNNLISESFYDTNWKTNKKYLNF